MRRAIGAILIGAMLTGCATVGRLAQYGSDGANFSYEGQSLTLALHPKDDVLLVRPALAEGVGRSFVRGATLGMAGREQQSRFQRAALNAFMAPVGCTVTEIESLDADAGYWEAGFECPPSVDLRALMSSQGPALRRGQALHR